MKGFCVQKAFFGIRNLNSHSGQAGQPPSIFPRDDYCKGRDFVLWGGIHSQGWTTRLRAGSDTPEVSLPVTCVPWCSCLVGSPMGLFLSMCMTLPVVRDGRVIPQQTVPSSGSSCASSGEDDSPLCCMDTTLSGSKTTPSGFREGGVLGDWSGPRRCGHGAVHGPHPQCPGAEPFVALFMVLTHSVTVLGHSQRCPRSSTQFSGRTLLLLLIMEPRCL